MDTTLVALTENERESYKLLGFQTPCHVVPNGIHVHNYLQNYNKDLSNALNIPPDTLMILFLGRIHPIKGADLLLDAFYEVVPEIPEALMVIAGPDESSQMHKLKNDVRIRDLSQKVLFPGMVSGEQKLQLLARADLFCLPSMAEGFSMAVLEAMASATPVMISPGCHLPEVERNGAGVVLERNPRKWAEGLVRLLKDPKKLRYMGQMTIRIVRESYTWEKVVIKLEEVYIEGIARHGKELVRR
jgi:glycosyltransferase involved in cell wall biosynthesis